MQLCVFWLLLVVQCDIRCSMVDIRSLGWVGVLFGFMNVDVMFLLIIKFFLLGQFGWWCVMMNDVGWFVYGFILF